MKKRKGCNKGRFKKIFKGFTLVELLAVIVILAIIMIIAIPNIINSMQVAKQKSIVTFGNKVLKLAQERYTEASTNGISIRKSTGLNIVVYDIRTDLVLTNAGDYYGAVYLNFEDNKVTKGLIFTDGDNILMYDENDGKPMDISYVRKVNDYNQLFITNNITKKFINYNFKDIIAYNFLYTRCNSEEIAVIDASTYDQLYCTNPSHKENINVPDGKGGFTCTETTIEGIIIESFIKLGKDINISNCA